MKKKIGKYEKMPVAAPAKQPKVKNLLLQTYFTSLLCLVLCVTMFMGTSYAWFTSEVTNTNNEIYVGTLKVGLYKENSDQTTATVEPLLDLADSTKNHKLFDSNIRWEPGYTALETIDIVNEGDLAFKYVLNFTEGKASNAKGEETALANVAQYFDVWVYDYYKNEYVEPTANDYTDITAGGTAFGTIWERAGSLDELLSGKLVLDGQMVTVRQDDRNDDPTTPNGTNDGVRTSDTYTIALHMKENATSDVMGKKITLNVKLVAYQMASENDAFGNDTYDDGIVEVTNTEELQAAIDNGETNIVLGTGEYEAELYANTASRNLTITGQGADTKLAFKNLQVNLAKFDSLTISNCTIERMPDKNWGHLVFGPSTTAGGVYTISNCVFNGKGSQGIYINQNVAATFNIENCTFNGDFGGEGAITIQNNDGAAITVNVTGCKFNSIPATSHEIFVHYAYDGWTLNADGVSTYWNAKK